MDTISAANLVFVLIYIGLSALTMFALVDALMRPQAVWRAAIEQPKALWIGILAAAAIFVILTGLNLLGLIGTVATIYYLVDVRRRLREVDGRGRRRW